MKKVFILSLFAVLSFSNAILADVKIKVRQSISGQSMENTTYIKAKRQRSEMMNGQMVTITQCDLRRDVQLNSMTKTFMVSPYDDGEVLSTEKVSDNQTKSVKSTKGGILYITTTNKDTGERKQMFGYTARHIIQTIEMESSPDSCNPTKSKMEIDAWVIDETFGFQCDRTQDYQAYNPRKYSGGCRDKIVPKTIGTAKSGYPLYQKITSFDDKGKESYSMVQEVVELSKATLDSALFEVPSDYKEVKDASQMYATASYSSSSNSTSYGSNYNSSSNSEMSQNVQNLSKNNSAPASEVGAKKEGVVRIGLPLVKVGAVGEGLNATDLSQAIQNSLADYLKGTKVELVQLEAKLPSAIAEEAKSKECDFVLYANVSHKKGGGGLGMFKKIAPIVGSVVPIAGVGGMVASGVINSAASMSGNVKAKDEISLDIKLQNGEANTFSKQYKAKAKSDGEDIISPMIEQIAQAILDAVKK